ncbi:low molecular weight protein-tyrosine-phosphatase [soil metagenome]
MAEAVLKSSLAKAPRLPNLLVDSAGTHANGGKPDVRAKTALQRRNYQPTNRRARRIRAQDFDKFDLILAMDRANLAYLLDLAPAGTEPKIRLFLDFDSIYFGQEMPDPYYGGEQGFERVLDLCEAGVAGLIAAIQSGETFTSA